MKSLSRRQPLRTAGAFTFATGLVSRAHTAIQSSFTVTIRSAAPDKTLKLADGSTVGAYLASM